MRPLAITLALVAGLASAARAQTAGQSGDRYANPPAASNSGRFADLFSNESSRYGDATAPAPARPTSPAAPAPAPATQRAAGGSTFEIRPLDTTPRSNSSAPAGQQRDPRSPAAAGPATRTLDPFATSPPRPSFGAQQPSAPRTAPPQTETSRATQPAGGYATGGGSSRYDAPPVAPRTVIESPSYNTQSTPPTGGSAFSSGAPSRGREATIHAVLADMLTPPRNSRLSGAPTRLATALASASTRDQQAQVVEAYWALTSATADYYLGLAEADELNSLRQRAPTYSQALGEALTGLNTRIETSLRGAQVAQLRLARVMGANLRPLPADIPFCGPYATRYNQRFSGGGPEESRLLNELLPARLAEMHAAADAIDRSDKWVGKVAAAGGSDVGGVLRALELVALNRRAFVQLARDYNLQINRYTQLVTPGEAVDTARLVAMLIRTGPTSGAASDRALAGGQGIDPRYGSATTPARR